MAEPPTDLKTRVLRQLAEERSLHGHGSCALIDHRLGRGKGYLGRLLRGEVGLQLATLAQVLDLLEVDVADFFTRAVGSRPEPLRVLRRLERKYLNYRRSRGLLDRPLRNRIERLVVRAPSEATAPTLPASAQDEAKTKADDALLASLEERMFCNPEAAAAAVQSRLLRCLEATETTSGDPQLVLGNRTTLARLLALLGSADRDGLCFGQAASSLRLAFELVVGRGLPRIEAEILQRSASLLVSQGELAVAALMLSLVADRRMLGAGAAAGGRHDPRPEVQPDRVWPGKLLAQQACVAAQLSEWSRAAEHFEASLGYLADDPHAWTWRLTAKLGLARLHSTARGSVTTPQVAEQWLARAVVEHRTRRGPSWWSLRHLEGELAFERGDLATAERAFRQAMEGFARRPHPGDWMLASIDLARVLWKAQQREPVVQLATQVVCGRRGYGFGQEASEALQSLARAALSGEIEPTLLRNASREIRLGCSAASFLTLGWMP